MNIPSLQTAERGRELRDPAKFMVLALELGLVLFSIWYFKLETPAFFRLCAIGFGGWVVHYFLPFSYRLPFFAALSLVGVFWTIGWHDALWLVLVGSGLIAICHLPLSVLLRSVLLLGAAAVLAVARVNWVAVPWSNAIWPILASMFMFRTAVYLYDRHRGQGGSLADTAAYFFMLPNVCFPLFPVVDYAGFRKTYYDADRHRIYQLGAMWIARGIIHLILYRFVYYYGSISPREVSDVGELARYVISGFLLYLRISGQFHIIVGMLHLFGFNLPETHHLYFLSSSIMDFWRRINIYWKDFMMKLVFFPVYFRIRRTGPTLSMVLATGVVFVATWALHAYQWFWFRGEYLLTWPDIVFWAILGMIVMIGAAREQRAGTKRPDQDPLHGKSLAWLSVRTAVTFTLIAILWSLWTTESLTVWLELWERVKRPSVADPLLIPVFLLGLAGFVIATIYAALRDRRRRGNATFSFGRAAMQSIGSLALASLLCSAQWYGQYFTSPTGQDLAYLLGSLRESRLSGQDARLMERGYYEELLNTQSFNSRLWELYSAWPAAERPRAGLGMTQMTSDFLRYEYVPNTVDSYKGRIARTNRWGMRDVDYEHEVPPNTCRMALIGSSHLESGKTPDDVVDVLLEARLKQSPPPQAWFSHCEILNFAVSGYNPLQELYAFERKALPFSPHILAYVCQSFEDAGAARHLAYVISNKIEIPYEELRDIARRANVEGVSNKEIVEQRLSALRTEILEWTYRRFVSLCRERGIVPVWLYLPTAGLEADIREYPRLEKIATRAGFLTISLTRVYEGHEPSAIWLTEWDHHPNELGRQLMAEEMHRQLLQRHAEIFVRPASPDKSPPSNKSTK